MKLDNSQVGSVAKKSVNDAGKASIISQRVSIKPAEAMLSDKPGSHTAIEEVLASEDDYEEMEDEYDEIDAVSGDSDHIDEDDGDDEDNKVLFQTKLLGS